MRRLGWITGLVVLAAGGSAWIARAQVQRNQDRLWQLRNIGKAFYENPTTQKEAVREFLLALQLAPGSARERLNYGLALLRAGDTQNAVRELEKVQKQDPALPHTWFNLGVTFKKNGDFDRALSEFQEFARLLPKEPVGRYQVGSLHKLKGDAAAAVREFEIARDLNPHLAAPHFQLYGTYRQLGRAQDAARELALFQALKKEQEGAAVPEDMDWCAYAEIYDPIDAPPPSPLKAPVYRDEKIADGFGGQPSGVAVLGRDLIAWSPAKVAFFKNGKTAATRIVLNGGIRTVTGMTPDSGLEDLRDVVFVAPGDFDNDGLLDLCVVTTRGAVLYRNVNGRFQKQADLAAGSFRKALWVDFDHDYDEDLLLIGNDSRLLRNNGQAGFSDESKRFPFVAGRALDAVNFDWEPDTPGFDIVVSYENRAGVIYRDKLGGAYEAVPLPELPAGAHSLIAEDVNRDGRTDLAALPALVLLNRPGKFEQGAGANRAGSVFADFQGMGRLDRARIAADGSLHIDRDVTPNYGNWIEVVLAGVKNPKFSLNAKVEVKAGSDYQKATYAGLPLVFRLGQRATVDTLRITWPNGLVQNERNPLVNRIRTIKEAPRLAGSCPTIFTWNGERFEFITDVLGVAPLGASSADGEYFPVDHDEYVSIRGESLKPRDGQYEIRVTEELREVSYIDQLKLIALDHPAAIDIVTNEKFKSPPFPEFRLFGIDRRVYPVSARDSQGRDVRAALLKRDHVYPDSFQRDHAGVAELHTLDLDFGSAAPENRAVLILNGWVDWADGSTFLAASQTHHDLVFPYLQVRDAAGNWKTVVEDMGMPSGKPKPMAVDLAGKFLSASRQVRIVTNLCVYWDEVFLVENNAAPPVRMTTLPIRSADLHFRGFSKATIHPERKQPEMFDYQTVNLASMWNPTPGKYTRYGPVEKLLAEIDDRMVVMGSGDEIRLRFDGTGLPPVQNGWKRDFLLLVDGWAKDADANTAFSQSVLPLPFHGMSRYPYPVNENFPGDAAHADYVKEYLTRPALRLIRPLTGAAE
jgi:tetratricopeptide (TPR) repeat protein